MGPTDIIAVVLGGFGFVLSIIGYVVTPYINLKTKKMERRLESRLQLFNAILEFWKYTHSKNDQKKDVSSHFEKINTLIQLYGYSREIKLFLKMVDYYNIFVGSKESCDDIAFKKQVEGFFKYSFNRYRKEINLDRLP